MCVANRVGILRQRGDRTFAVISFPFCVYFRVGLLYMFGNVECGFYLGRDFFLRGVWMVFVCMRAACVLVVAGAGCK